MDEKISRKEREAFDRFKDGKITEEQFSEQVRSIADDPEVTAEQEMRELGLVDDDHEEGG